jgi:protein O-GlcNAc transferase
MDFSALTQKMPALSQNWKESSVYANFPELEAIASQVVGTTTLNVLQLLNFAVGLLTPGEVYCEVGCFQGRSLIAALLNHPDQMAYAVDHFAEMNFQGENLEIFAENLTEFNLSNQVFLCAQKFEDFFSELGSLELEDQIGVFFYDANQDYQSQLLALLSAKPFLANQAVLIVNGSNSEFTRQAILDFLVTTPEAYFLLDLQEYKHETYPFLDGVCVLAWDRQQTGFTNQSSIQKQHSSTAAITTLSQTKTITQQDFLEQLLAEAVHSQEANDHTAAITKYQQYLLWKAEDFSTWLNLGVLYFRNKQYLQAIEALTHAQKLDESNSLPYFNLGLAFEACGDLQQAISAYQAAIACDPQFSEAYNNLGAILLHCGELAKAEMLFRQSTVNCPDDFKGHLNLGNALIAQEKIAEAISAYKIARQIKPDNLDVQKYYEQAISAQRDPTELQLECGLLAYRNGKYSEAVIYLQKVLDVKQGDPLIFKTLADCYKRTHKEIEAISTLEQSLHSYPNFANQIELAFLLRHFGHIDRAHELLTESLLLFPNSLLLRIASSLLLPLFYDTHAEMAEYRQQFSQSLNALLQDLSNNTVTQSENDISDIYLALTTFESNQFFLAYLGFNDLELQQKRGRFVEIILRKHFSNFMQPLPMPPHKGKIRVGYLVQTIKNGSLGELFIGWLRHHNSEDFEIYCYHIGEASDYLTHEFRQHSDSFSHIPNDVVTVCQKVLADQLHILVYPVIGLDVMILTLAGLRLAPIQCTSWCHPVTTGLSSIDYFLSCESMEIAGAETHYSEQLVRLPKIGIAFPKPMIPVPTKNRADFGIPIDEIAYLSCQTTYKYQPDHDFIYPEIAQQVPNAKFIFIEQASRNIGRKFQQRLKRCFLEHGLSSDDYCIFLPRMPENDYLSLNQCSDIFLDTLSWSGGVTTLKAIACDLPVVTCPGEMMRSRHTYGILKTLGVTSTVADTAQEYINIAVRLALDLDWRLTIIDQMKQQHERLYDDKTCISALEDFYQQVVKKFKS